MSRCKIADNNTVTVASVLHDFGVVDERGRKLGARVAFSEVELVEVEAGADRWACRTYSKPAGYYFLARMQATRDGSLFGATQLDNWYTTEAERDAAVAKYLKQARSRALKLAK